MGRWLPERGGPRGVLVEGALLWPIKDCRWLMSGTRDYVRVRTTGPIMGGACSVELVRTEPVLWE
jgi:hypothetical protein